MPGDDLVVELPAEEPEKKEVVVEAESPIDDLKKQLADHKAAQETQRAQLDTATREAELARAEAARATEATKTAEKARDESNVAVLDNAIAAAQAEADGFQRDIQTSFEASDFTKAAEFSRKLAKAEARVAQLEAGKADLEFRNKQEAEKPKEQPKPQSLSDPFEAAIAPLSQRTQRWFREQKTAGRDYIGDKTLNAKATSAHYGALAEGFSPDTDGYFEFCEKALGLREQKTIEPKARTAAMPSAPVSRDNSPSGGQLSPTQVVLTKGEVLAAEDGTIVYNWNDPGGKFKKGDPIGRVEMAKRKMAMQKEGRYGVLTDS